MDWPVPKTLDISVCQTSEYKAFKTQHTEHTVVRPMFVAKNQNAILSHPQSPRFPLGVPSTMTTITMWEDRRIQWEIRLQVASYSFLTARNLVTKKWLVARALKSSCDFARPMRGFPTQEVNKHGFPTLPTLFSSKTCELINFLKCLPTCKKVADYLESKRRFKKIISPCSEQLMSL